MDNGRPYEVDQVECPPFRLVPTGHDADKVKPTLRAVESARGYGAVVPDGDAGPRNRLDPRLPVELPNLRGRLRQSNYRLEPPVVERPYRMEKAHT